MVGRRVHRVRAHAGRVRARAARVAAGGRSGGCSRSELAFARARGRARARARGRLRELRPARRDDAPRLVVPVVLRDGVVGRARRGDHPVGRRVLGVARTDEADRRRTTSTSSRCSRSRSPCRASTRRANLGVPDLLFFALFLGCGRAIRAARRPDVARAWSPASA